MKKQDIWAYFLGVCLVASVLFIAYFGDEAIKEREEQRRVETPISTPWGQT